MPAVDDEKLAEHIFTGSLSLLAVLIAVAGIGAAGYEKISGIPDVEPHFRWLLFSIGAVALLASVVSCLALEKARGRTLPIGIILWPLRVLMAAAALASVGIVAVTIY
jgi:hypothetical protein